MKIYFSISYIAERILFFLLVLLSVLCVLPVEREKTTLVLLILLCTVIVVLVSMMVTDRLVRRYAEKNNAVIECKPHKNAKTASVYIALSFLLLVTILPFYVVLVTSVKTNQEANSVVFTWIPQMGVTLENYKVVWTEKSTATTLVKSFFNTLLTSVPTSLAAVFISGLSAYAFARLEFKGKKALFNVLLFSMMTPSCIMLTTSYVIFDRIGWVNTFYPLIVPMLFGNASVVFFLRQYFLGIPQEILDSAKMDGLGKMGVFFRIIVPLSYPAYMAQFILTFIARYNEYLGPLLYLQRPKYYTLSIYLKFFSGSASVQAELVASACMITIIPLVVIYIVFQKKILSGIAMSSGLKG